MAALEIWILKNLGFIGVAVMVILGSTVAHIKNYEQSNREWSTREHFWGLVRRMIYGSMAGIFVYLLHIEYHFSEPMSYIFTGIAAIFASDLFDFLWIKMREKLSLIFGGTGNGKNS